MATLGKIEEFHTIAGNIEQYFEANGVAVDDDTSHKRRAILISVIGAKAYDVLSDLCSPASPSAKTYTELSTILKSHFAPKRLVIAERYRFHSCNQAPGETVSTFVANLKRLAATCNFGTHLNEALRDRFICGIHSEQTKRKLLTADYTFEQALKLALSMETAEKDVRELSTSNTTASNQPVNKVTGKPGRRFNKYENKKPPKPEVQENTCLSCGKTGHKRANCKYKSYTCNSCNKKGHLAQACLSKGTKQIVVVEESASDNQSDTRYDSFSTSMYKIGKHGIDVSLEVEGISLTMELDTGAGASIISEQTYQAHFREIPLKPCSTKLHTYTGEPIQALGLITVDVKHKDQSVSLPLVVVQGQGPSLLGRDWLKVVKLDWEGIFNLKGASPELSRQEKLQALLDAHAELFQAELGTIKGITAKLQMKEGATPKFCKARPVPYSLLDAVNEEYDRLERQGIVEKIEFSEWATPMVHIPKSDGTTRSCGDYAVTVNPQLYVPHYPIPLPEEVFHKLRGGQLFTKLDLKNAYQQLLIDEDSLPYVTINTHRGLYRYTRLPFGIASSPALFQKTIDTILQGLDHVASIQDDILVTGSNDTEHLQNLEKVLQRLKEYGLRLKLEKCKFMEKSVVYMGCVISREGIAPTEEKIEALKQAPRPECVSQLRSFLGMVNYHGKWIPNLSTILHPLNKLLQKGQTFKWSKECENAFQQAKNSLTSSKVLVHYNPDLPLVLECDASPYGIGAVISHRLADGTEKPIAYASRSLSQAERNYSQIEKEGLAIIFGVTKFYMYVYAREFILYTDHRPLLKIFAPDSATPVLAAARLQRWSLLLSSYQYQIEYRSSSAIANADALSRLPLAYRKDASVEERIYKVAAQAVERHPVSAQRIATETAHDKTLSKALQLTQEGWNMSQCEDPELKPYFCRKYELSVEQGCLMWGLRVIIPTTLRQQVLDELHWAHPGVSRMKAMARAHFWWPNNILTTIYRSWHDLAMIAIGSELTHPRHHYNLGSGHLERGREYTDFATYNNQHYLVMVDAYSKWPEVIGPMRSTNADATTSAMRNIFSRYGIPDQVVSDRGPPFQSADYEDFLRKNAAQRVLVSPYHQSSNGQVERFIQTFKRFLETSRTQPNLLSKIPNFLLTYRSTPHATTGTSPAKLFLGREVRTRLSIMKPDIASRVAVKQSEMKHHHDHHSKLREFKVGDSVLARDYRSRDKWQPATVVRKTAPYSYLVQLKDDNLTWHRHADQLLGQGAAVDSKNKQTDISAAQPIPSMDIEVEVPHVPSAVEPVNTEQTPTVAPEFPSVSEASPDPKQAVTSATEVTTPVPSQKPIPAPRRSTRMIKPPQRLLEQI